MNSGTKSNQRSIRVGKLRKKNKWFRAGPCGEVLQGIPDDLVLVVNALCADVGISAMRMFYSQSFSSSGSGLF